MGIRATPVVPLSALVGLLSVLGAALGVIGLTLKARDGSHPTADLVFGGVAGFLFLAAGLVAHARNRPDVAIIDIRLPPGPGPAGLLAAVEIRRDHPDVGVLLLSQYVEAQYFTTLVAAGMRKVGYLLKERVSGKDGFVSAVRRIAAGDCVIDPEISSLLLNDRPQHGLAGLTERQADVLAQVAEGFSNNAIAARLGISTSTVETHARAVYQALGIQDEKDTHQRVLAALMYRRANQDRA